MVLPFFCGSATKSSTRPITSGPVTSAPGLLDGLDLEADPDQRFGHVPTGALDRRELT